MLSLTDREWAEFRVGDIFIQERGREPSPKSFTPGDIRIISETAYNNGLVGYATPNKIIKGNCISVSVNNAKVVFYQPLDFCASVNIMVLRNSKLTEKSALFIIPILIEANMKYNYGTKQSKDRLNATIIRLPINSEGQPDYDFMEQYIVEREPDYSWATDSIAEYGTVKLTDRPWKEFKVGDLFKFTRGKRVNKSVVLENPGKIPLISGGDESNGVMGYISEELAKSLRFMESCITVSSYGSSGSVHYQGMSCCMHDNAMALNIKDKLHDNDYTNLFMTTVLQKLKENYAYGRPVIADRYKEEIISLPVTAEGQPDYNFMEQYIKSLPFSVVLDNFKN